MKRTAFPLALFLFFFPFFAEAQDRSFSSLYPGMSGDARAEVFSDEGITLTRERAANLELLSPALGELNLELAVREHSPRVLTESLRIIPAGTGVTLLDIYNALGNVRGLKGRLYNSFTRGRPVPLFENATRIAGPSRRTAIPDPPPAAALPQEDTIYIDLDDVNFGHCFYRADVSVAGRGILYSLTNFRTISYLVVPVMREGRFFARFYIEPLAEGVLLYCLAGADVSDFVAGKIDMPSAIEKRLLVIRGWVSDGLRRENQGQ